MKKAIKEITLIDQIYGSEGMEIRVRVDGKEIKRRVYYSRADGLYIRINNKKYFEYDFRYNDTLELDELGLPIEKEF